MEKKKLTKEELLVKEEKLKFLLSKLEEELKEMETQHSNLKEIREKIEEKIKEGNIEAYVQISTSDPMVENLLTLMEMHIKNLKKSKEMMERKLQYVRAQLLVLDKLSQDFPEAELIDMMGKLKITYKNDDTDSSLVRLRLSQEILEELQGELDKI